MAESDRITANKSYLAQYADNLRQIFFEWGQGPSLAATLPYLGHGLQDQAVRAFPLAFALGRYQSGESGAPLPKDQLWLERELELNGKTITGKLLPKIGAKLHFGGEEPRDRLKLVQGFEKRIHALYGGALWGIIEGGFLFGAQSQGLSVYRSTSPEQAVCGPCQDSIGSYSPYENPMIPGRDCIGTTLCRCYFSLIS